ncbi:MAG: phosphatase PAP2 family protein, partial [Candidatus Altiarchaeota archaeon]
ELWILGTLALIALLSYLSGLDYALAKALSHRTPIGISLLESSWYYLFFELSALVYLLMKKRRAAVSLILSVALLYLMQVAFTEFAPRERPPEAMPVGDFLMDLIRSTGASSSFFSGHSATAVAVYTIFQMINFHPLLVLLLALPVLISRLTLVQHYLSDVIGGAIFGYVTTKIIYTIIKKKTNDGQ